MRASFPKPLAPLSSRLLQHTGEVMKAMNRETRSVRVLCIRARLLVVPKNGPNDGLWPLFVPASTFFLFIESVGSAFGPPKEVWEPYPFFVIPKWLKCAHYAH